MKKFLVLLSCLLLLTSCMTNKLDPSTLESNVFTVSEVRFFAEESSEIFREDCFNDDFLKYLNEDSLAHFGIDLDFSLFSAEDYENYSVANVDDFSTKYSFIKKETDSTQTALIEIVWNAAYNYPMWQVYLTLEDGKVYDFVSDNKYWAKNPYIADKENASLVKVDMYVDIQQVNGESFYSYSKNNEGEKLYHYYFPTDEEIELVYTVTDTSSKREITFSNLKETVKFESGKNYKIDFKISDRFLNAIENWKVELKIKEIN